MAGPSFPLPDLDAAAERLAEGCFLGPGPRVHFIGVHHGSPRMAQELPALLDELAPALVVLELPSTLQPHLDYLTYPAGGAPTEVELLAAIRSNRRPPPTIRFALPPWCAELALLRWAREHDVPRQAIDLCPFFELLDDADPPIPALRVDPLHRLAECLRCPQADLWDRLVEQAPPYTEPERLRRLALGLGWALRYGRDTAPDPRVLAREAAMRTALARLACTTDGPIVWLGGSVHAAGLLPPGPDDPWARVPDGRTHQRGSTVTPVTADAFGSGE